MNNESKINKTHYFDRGYLKRERMYSFIEQIELVKKFAKIEDTILEVGKGNGFVSGFVKDFLNYSVKSMDINKDLKPDILDDIANPKQIQEKSFDIVTCFEVLEHIPFDKSVEAVQNMSKIAGKYILISVPDMRYFAGFKFSVFGTLPVSLAKLITTKRFRKKNKTFGKDHFWEIGIKTDGVDYTAKYVKNNLFAGMNPVEDFRCFLTPWHHYYVVKV